MSLNAKLKPTSIPVLLLKTRSHPHDTYEEYFSDPLALSGLRAVADDAGAIDYASVQFSPRCIPVLEHKQNEETLNALGKLLRDGHLKEQYGGMIFTSQRAVEAWADTVKSTENEDDVESDLSCSTVSTSQPQTTALDSRSGSQYQTDILTSTSFPLYVVGPATARALATLLSTLKPHSPFLALRPSIHGAETGSGSLLAPFILKHYNTLHAEKWFTWHDAPRLPFVPLLGMGSENYSRRRLDPDDPRLQKHPLLFLVGEQRRDIIPRTLMDEKLGSDKTPVNEVEVYKTDVRSGFQDAFNSALTEFTDEAMETNAEIPIIIVVVFSPQGSGEMLHALGFLDPSGHTTEQARRRWDNAYLTTRPSSISNHADLNTTNTRDQTANSRTKAKPTYLIATIGPTTRDHLVQHFGFEPDVCAATPTPEGVSRGVVAFLTEKRILYQ